MNLFHLNMNSFKSQTEKVSLFLISGMWQLSLDMENEPPAYAKCTPLGRTIHLAIHRSIHQGLMGTYPPPPGPLHTHCVRPWDVSIHLAIHRPIHRSIHQWLMGT